VPKRCADEAGFNPNKIKNFKPVLVKFVNRYSRPWQINNLEEKTKNIYHAGSDVDQRKQKMRLSLGRKPSSKSYE